MTFSIKLFSHHSITEGYMQTHPILKTSASLRNAELINIGNGYFSNKLGNRTMASHWSPPLVDRKPEKGKHLSLMTLNFTNHNLMMMNFMLKLI